MANPQKENGYTAIANEIMDAMIAANLSGHELRLSLLIMRKTYGYNKCEDAVALSQMMKATGLGKIRCSQVINRLQLMKIVTVTENINGIGKKYKFNKDFDEWDTVTEKCNSYRKVIGTVTEKRNRPLQKTVNTKDTLTKDTLTKDKIYIVEIVSYLNQKTGKKFTPKSKTTISHIKARLAEGYAVEDFKTVIDNQCSKWLTDAKMVDYLRPVTLFGTKFESYLNATSNPLAGKVSPTTIKNIEVLKNWSPKNAE